MTASLTRLRRTVTRTGSYTPPKPRAKAGSRGYWPPGEFVVSLIPPDLIALRSKRNRTQKIFSLGSLWGSGVELSTEWSEKSVAEFVRRYQGARRAFMPTLEKPKKRGRAKRPGNIPGSRGVARRQKKSPKSGSLGADRKSPRPGLIPRSLKSPRNGGRQDPDGQLSKIGLSEDLSTAGSVGSRPGPR